jgi:site-specific DNA-methyltransferase (adenine-specific)
MRDNKIFRIQDIIFYNGDFLKFKGQEGKVELIVTSPPYNIGIDYGKYDDNKTYKEYLEFTKAWLGKTLQLLKDNGRICINVPIDTGKFGKRSLAADLTILAKRAGFKYKGTIIWNKQNSKNKFAMNFSKNVEVILIFYKEEWKAVPAEYREWVNEVWQFSGENPKRVNHPAAFPVEIPRRLIKMFSEKGDTILDPFLGSGTTMVASKRLLRKGIGIELDAHYFEVAKKRVTQLS